MDGSEAGWRTVPATARRPGRNQGESGRGPEGAVRRPATGPPGRAQRRVVAGEGGTGAAPEPVRNRPGCSSGEPSGWIR